MTAGPSPGQIAITIGWQGGRIGTVSILNTRPRWLARSMAGREAHDVPRLARLLFGLCGTSHEAAARLALSAAGALPQPPRREVALAVLAERFGSLARSTLLGQEDNTRAALHAAAALRAYAMAERRLAEVLDGGADRPGRAGALADAAEALLPPLRAALSAEAIPTEAESARCPAPDTLAPADDEEVAARLASDPDGFGAAPSLPGRIVETGPHARQGRTGTAAGAAEARLASRLWDFEETARTLRAWDDCEGQLADAGVLDCGSTGEREGWSAVETGRGRLHHWVRIGRNGSVERYGIVAPTEWNFHPQGPLARSLACRQACSAEAALADARRLATLFDPCVAFEVRLREPAHA